MQHASKLLTTTGRTSVAPLRAALAAVALVGAACATPAPTPPPAADPMVGKLLSLTAADLRSEGTFDLATLRGQVVIVDFWASWCAPCRESLPFYEKLYGARAKDGLRIVGVSIDVERALAERFLQEVPTSFAMAWDANQRLAAQLALDTMPTALVVDREGVVRAVHRGFVDADRAPLEELVGKLLAEPAAAPAPPT